MKHQIDHEPAVILISICSTTRFIHALMAQDGDEPRYDFGMAFYPTRCSDCQNLTRNRGCKACELIFCKEHFLTHRSNGCPKAGASASSPANAAAPPKVDSSYASVV